MKKYDCIVAGAGLSGFAAAVGAAQAGAKVLLIDRLPAAGGTAVYGLTPILSGWHKNALGNAVGSMLAEKLKTLNAFDWRVNKIVTHEDRLQQAMIEVLADAGVETLYNATVCGADRQGDVINSISVMTIGGVMELAADAFVDASGDAVLSVLAGAEIVVPDDEESMTKTLMFKVRNVKGFDRDTVIAQFKEHVNEFPVKIQNSFMGMPLLEREEVVMNLTAVPGNAADPELYSDMYEQLYRQIEPIMEFMRRNVPCFAEAVVTKVAPIVGVRYSRSVKGERGLTIEDIFNPETPAEPVAFCGTFIGGHYIKHFESPWGGKITGKPAVPYGAIKVRGIKNLLTAGRIIDIDPRAVSAIRLAAGCLATGQAAGIAAALKVPSYETLRKELDRQGCMSWLENM